MDHLELYLHPTYPNKWRINDIHIDVYTRPSGETFMRISGPDGTQVVGQLSDGTDNPLYGNGITLTKDNRSDKK